MIVLIPAYEPGATLVDLVRCLAPRSDHGRNLWLFTHERCRHTPRVRAVIDFLYERLSRHVRKLEMKRATEAAAAA